jgi:acyl phosphate:glycerol-3-phosphate acyltransferase
MTGMIVLSLFVSYVLGSIPTGLWVGLAVKKIDIREHGSKNIGATNTLRVLGKGFGTIAMIGDISKSVVSVLFVSQLSEWVYAPLACGLAAILGHTFSLFIKFKGGKGAATSAGVFVGLAPIPMAFALTVFVLSVVFTRMVGLASILAAITLSVTLWTLGDYDISIKAIGTLVAVIIIIRHRENIQRMIAGKENKI